MFRSKCTVAALITVTTRALSQFLMVLGLAACTRHQSLSTSEPHCPDPPVGGIVEKQDSASAPGDSVGLLVRIRVVGGGALEPSVLRVTQQGTQLPLPTPLPTQPGVYQYPPLMSGWYFIELRRIGYNAVTDSVELSQGRKAFVTVGMRYKVTCLI